MIYDTDVALADAVELDVADALDDVDAFEVVLFDEIVALESGLDELSVELELSFTDGPWPPVELVVSLFCGKIKVQLPLASLVSLPAIFLRAGTSRSVYFTSSAYFSTLELLTLTISSRSLV